MASTLLDNGFGLASEQAGGLAVVSQLQVVRGEAVPLPFREFQDLHRGALHRGRNLHKALGSSGDGNRGCRLRNIVHGMVYQDDEARVQVTLAALRPHEGQAAVHAKDVGGEGYKGGIARIVVEGATGT